MNYENIVKEATFVDYSTLLGSLNKTISEIFDPITLYNNVHVYTESLYKLRINFLEPLMKQHLRNHAVVLNAIASRNNLELKLKQAAFIILNINDEDRILNWIKSIKDNEIPLDDYKKNIPLYKSFTLLNGVTHDSQNTYIRTQYLESFFQCYLFYRQVNPEAKIPIDFKDANAVELFVSDALRKHIQENENKTEFILNNLRNLEKLNSLRISDIEVNARIIDQKETAIMSLNDEKHRLTEIIHIYTKSIEDYLRDRKINDSHINQLVDMLIKHSPEEIKLESLRLFETFKRTSLKLENILNPKI